MLVKLWMLLLRRTGNYKVFQQAKCHLFHSVYSLSAFFCATVLSTQWLLYFHDYCTLSTPHRTQHLSLSLSINVYIHTLFLSLPLSHSLYLPTVIHNRHNILHTLTLHTQAWSNLFAGGFHTSVSTSLTSHLVFREEGAHKFCYWMGN